MMDGGSRVGTEVTIDPDTAQKHIEERIGVGPDEELRTSSRRESYLKRFTRVMTGENVELHLHPSAADTNFEKHPPRIRIPGPEESFTQTYTDFNNRIYDMMVQETISLHEAGHVLYTDWGSFSDKIEILDQSFRPVFKEVWNVLEDGAIEEQLRNEFNCERELLVYNTNAVEQNTFGTQTNPNEVLYTLHDAVTAALVDLCIIDSGALEDILDDTNSQHSIAKEADEERFKDFLPRLEEVAVDYLSEPDGKERTEILWEFWQDYKDLLDDADVGGMQSAQNRGGQPVFSGKGNDAMDGYSLRGMDERNRDAEYDALQLPDKEELEERISAGDAGEDEEGEEGDEIGSAGGSQDEAEEAEEEIQEKYEAEVKREAQEEGGQMLDEALEYKELLEELAGDGAGYGDLGELEVGVASKEEDWNAERWSSVKRRSRMIEEALRRRLRRETRAKTKRKRRRGTFDSREMITAARGKHRVFKRTKEGRQKDYACMVVVDRSGSMAGDHMEIAEKGASAFLIALENLGIDVSMIDLHNNIPRLVVPLGDSVENQRPRLFTDETGGGTPMSDMIHLAKERLEREADRHPFMIVITDGRPGRPEQYKDALDTVNFPVIGINIDTGGGSVSVEAEDFFHRQTKVTGENELYSRLEGLAEEVMF